MKQVELIIYIAIVVAAVYLVIKHWRTGKKK